MGKTEMTLVVQRREAAFSQDVIVEAKVRYGTRKVPPAERGRKLKCPACQAALIPINYNYCSGIIIDRCPHDHGVFLDRGELELVQAHTEWMDAAMDGSLETYLEDKNKSRDETVMEAERDRLSLAELEVTASIAKGDEKMWDKILAWLGRYVE